MGKKIERFCRHKTGNLEEITLLIIICILQICCCLNLYNKYRVTDVSNAHVHE